MYVKIFKQRLIKSWFEFTFWFNFSFLSFVDKVKLQMFYLIDQSGNAFYETVHLILVHLWVPWEEWSKLCQVWNIFFRALYMEIDISVRRDNSVGRYIGCSCVRKRSVSYRFGTVFIWFYRLRGGFRPRHLRLVTYRNLVNCIKSFKIMEVPVLILVLIQIWRTRKSFLNPPLQGKSG